MTDWGKREDWEKRDYEDSAIECDYVGCNLIWDWGTIDEAVDNYLCDTHFQEVFGRKDFSLRDGDSTTITVEGRGKRVQRKVSSVAERAGAHIKLEAQKAATEFLAAREDKNPTITGKLKPGFKKVKVPVGLCCSSCGYFTKPWLYENTNMFPATVLCQSCATYQESDFEKSHTWDMKEPPEEPKCCYDEIIAQEKKDIGSLHDFSGECYRLKKNPGGWGWICKDHYQELVGIKEDKLIRARKDPLYFAQQYLYYDEFATWDKAKVESAIKELTPKREKGKLMSVLHKVKQLAKSKDQRVLEEARVIDDCGNVNVDSDEVVEMLLSYVLEENKADIVDKLEKVKAEEKKSK